jgi:hypothetical protein
LVILPDNLVEGYQLAIGLLVPSPPSLIAPQALPVQGIMIPGMEGCGVQEKDFGWQRKSS